jgi:hypothetical protein
MERQTDRHRGKESGDERKEWEKERETQTYRQRRREGDRDTLSKCKHRAFFRVVKEKWTAYAINTAILHLMGLTTREEDGSLSLIPTPWILEDACPVSMEDLQTKTSNPKT